MIGIDLFAGAGGMTLGAKLAGINIKYAVENDPHASQTYRLNNQDVVLLDRDIQTIKSIPIRRDEELVVFGGPPCQGFSTSNQKTRSIKNPNNWLFREFIRFVKSFKPLPEWIVFENVKGFSETEDGIFLESVFQEFESLGYTIESEVLNAADYGVAQKRSRFFAIGSLVKKEICFPTKNIKKYRSVSDAISDLPSLQNGECKDTLQYKKGSTNAYSKLLRSNLDTCYSNYVTKNSDLVIERYSHIPQGGNWENIPSHLMNNYTDRTRCHSGIYHRLRQDEPSIVIGNYRKNMLIHPWEDRGLSVREAARLQSFPDWYLFEGSIGFQQQQVGNAVPPLLAKAIFQTIIDN